MARIESLEAPWEEELGTGILARGCVLENSLQPLPFLPYCRSVSMQMKHCQFAKAKNAYAVVEGYLHKFSSPPPSQKQKEDLHTVLANLFKAAESF